MNFIKTLAKLFTKNNPHICIHSLRKWDIEIGINYYSSTNCHICSNIYNDTSPKYLTNKSQLSIIIVQNPL